MTEQPTTTTPEDGTAREAAEQAVAESDAVADATTATIAGELVETQAAPGETVNAATGEVTPAGEPLPEATSADPRDGIDLAGMTKAELVAFADAHGFDLAGAKGTKAKALAALTAAPWPHADAVEFDAERETADPLARILAEAKIDRSSVISTRLQGSSLAVAFRDHAGTPVGRMIPLKPETLETLLGLEDEA